MKRVITLGSIIMDLMALVPAFPEKGETTVGTEFLTGPGGKGANQAVAAAMAGTETILIGRIGNDAYGAEMKKFLTSRGVNCDAVSTDPQHPSGKAIVMVDAAGENKIIIFEGANRAATPDDFQGVNIDGSDVLVTQLEIPSDAIEAFFLRGEAVGAVRVFNAAPFRDHPRRILELTSILVVNEPELCGFAGIPVTDNLPDAKILGLARSIQANQNQKIVVTRGARGVVALDAGEFIAIPGRTVDVIDTTGAGDCFVGVMAAQLAKGEKLRSALTTANVAASISVTRRGTGSSMPTRDEIAQAMNVTP